MIERQKDRQLQLNLTSATGKAAARRCAVRLAAFLLAVLVALSGFSVGGGHAHAALEVHVATDMEAAVSHDHAHQGHVNVVPCDDDGNDEDRQDGCCISISSCGICAPVPSAGIAFLSQRMPAASARLSASHPRYPPTFRRPPKLSVTA